MVDSGWMSDQHSLPTGITTPSQATTPSFPSADFPHHHPAPILAHSSSPSWTGLSANLFKPVQVDEDQRSSPQRDVDAPLLFPCEQRFVCLFCH